LRIAVNTRLLLKNRLEGIGWFSKETLLRITQNHPEHEFIFFFDRKFDPSYIFSNNVTGIVLFPQARHPILYKFFFNWAVPRALKKVKADIFISPDGFLSLRTTIPQIAVIHDLNFEHHPEILPPSSAKYYRKYFPLFAKKAARIASVSRYSKQDISKTYHINPDKIDVVYNGANNAYKPLAQDEIKTIRASYSKGKPYFIFIGSLHPRKNIINLLRAYEIFRASSSFDFPLLIVGEAMWSNKDVELEFSKMTYKEDVVFLGRLRQIELSQILGAAFALTFIPLFEGFGIPALEAMQSGVPVITSNNTSIPEVVGNAAIQCDPNNVKAIFEAMLKCAEEDFFRKEMIEIGLIQSKKFSWDQSANLLWESIEKVLKDA
jgi:glycosyltransferase involved in cell wall biosynthesis